MFLGGAADVGFRPGPGAAWMPRRDARIAHWVADDITATTWPDRSPSARNASGSGTITHKVRCPPNGRPTPLIAGWRVAVTQFMRALTDFTITTLSVCYADNPAVPGYNSWVGEGPSNSPYPDWAFAHTGNTIIASFAQGTPPTPQPTFYCRFGHWVAVTMVKQGSTARFYFNGALNTNASSFAFYGSSWGSSFGLAYNAYPYDARGLNPGSMAEVIVQNVPLQGPECMEMWHYLQAEWGMHA